jgi:hypothetical protein
MLERGLTRTEIMPFSFQWVFQAAENVVRNLGWTLLSSNPETGEVWAKTTSSLKSRGEDIHIRTSSSGKGSSITITSKLSSQIIGWGKNADNQKDFFSQISLEILKLLPLVRE